MFVHLRGEDVLPTSMALLQNFSLFGFGNDLLFHRFGDHRGVLLYSCNQLTLPDALVVGIEGNSFHKFEIVPIDIALLHLLICLLLLSSRLLLFGLVVIEDQAAFFESLLRIAGETSKSVQLFILELKNVSVGSD